MRTSNHEWIQATCNWLKLASNESSNEALNSTLAEADAADLQNLLEVLTANFDVLNHHPKRLRLLMQLVAARALEWVSAQANANEPSDEQESVAVVEPEIITQLYDRLLEVDGNAAAHALQLLAMQTDEESISHLSNALLESPPPQWQQVALGLSPLWKADPDLLELFFDRMQDGYASPTAMAVLLDLANYSHRKHRFTSHPWHEKCPELTSLLNSLIVQLQRLERQPQAFGQQVDEVQRILADSVALTIGLCDALGLIGDPAAIPALTEALELSHRRIQTEAAAALALLGDSTGKEHLIQLASDPVARLRAVAFAEELDFADEIDEALRHPQALAESELAAWLASPEQFGLPPSSLELVDARTQYWPSYDEPQSCFLFRYRYQLAAGEISNVGIAGPATHAFHADLGELAPEDIYAAFAGWQAEHDDIYEVPVSTLNVAQRREADRLMALLEAGGFESVQPIALTFLLGEVALLAIAQRDGESFSVVIDLQENACFPLGKSPTSLTPEVALAIYRGRKLLRTFNH